MATERGALASSEDECAAARKRAERLSGLSGTDAVWKLQGAAEKRSQAAWLASQGDKVGAHIEIAEAADLERDASDILDPSMHTTAPVRIGRGGELATGVATMRSFLDTVRTSPDMLAHEASRERLDLASRAGALATGLDVAETIGASNSLEKMLAHELATMHILTMKNAATAASFAAKAADNNVPAHQRQIANVEATRSTNAAARASETFQRGLLTLDRIRNGGRQNVVVQHVNVADRGAGRGCGDHW